MCGFENSQPDAAHERPRGRLFTLAEANRALPLVRRIAADVVSSYGALAQVLLKRQQAAERNDAAAADALEAEARAGAAQVNELIDELHAIGCELKDWETGLVDFRALRDGEVVYLCWRLGEEHIAFWHELHAGVAGRQPIDDRFDEILPEGEPPATRRQVEAPSATRG